jgi:hypothetical protein
VAEANLSDPIRQENANAAKTLRATMSYPRTATAYTDILWDTSMNGQAKKSRIKRKWRTNPYKDWARLDLELKERPALSINELRQEALSLAGAAACLGKGLDLPAKGGEIASNPHSYGILLPPRKKT